MRVVVACAVAALLIPVEASRADVLGRIRFATDATTSGAGAAVGSAATVNGSASQAPLTAPSTPPPAHDLESWAGAPQPTTLPQLLAFAVANAPALQSAKFDIAIAEAQVRETWERADWHVAASLGGSRQTGELGGFLIGTTTVYAGSGDAYRTFSTGGTVDFHVSSTYQSSSYSGADAAFLPATTEWQDVVTGAITQPLLKGRGRELYDAAENRAKLQVDIATLQRRLVAIQAVQNVVSAYWDLVLAERQVAISQQSLDLARERLRVTTVQAEGGKTARSEIPAVEQIIATREEDVLNGELAVLNASIALRRACAMPIGAGALGLRVASDVDFAAHDWDVGKLVDSAFAAAPQLAELVKQGDQAKIDTFVTKNGLLPQLDAALTLGPSGTNSTFASAARDLVEFSGITVAGSLTFSRALRQYDIHGKLDELAAGVEKLAVSAVDVKSQIAQTVASAIAQAELAQRRVELGEREIALANENIRIETDRFNVGRITNFEVLNRLDDLRTAELRKAQAMVDWHKAEATVQALTGDILTVYGVDVK